MRCSELVLGAVVLFCGAAQALAASTVQLTPTEDAFARQLDGANNYGGGGALAVSGSASVNGSSQPRGRADTLMKYNTASAVSQFDANFGAGNWTVTEVRLHLAEVGAPTSALFARGAGDFSVSWLSSDDWSEGSGTPAAPTVGAGNQLTWNYLQMMLGSASESALGTFASLGADGALEAVLARPASFVGDIAGAGSITLHVAPASDGLGLTFNSRTFSSANLRPVLEITAVPEPGSLGALATPIILFAVANRRRL